MTFVAAAAVDPTNGKECCGVPCDDTSQCSANMFCCPNHHECMDSSTQSTEGPNCDAARDNGCQSSGTAKAVMKLLRGDPVKNVQCDATSYCADGSHCCFYSTGAVAGCCTDGYTCDVAAGTCDQAGKKSYPFMITVDRKKAKVLHVESKAHCSEVHIPAKEYK